MLAAATKMEVRQIEHWFTNKRKRGWRQAMRESSASSLWAVTPSFAK